MKTYTYFLFVLLVVLIAISTPGAIVAQEDTAYPAPTGPYSVGKTSRHWVDENREETFSDDPDDHRELMVRIWYPAQVEPDAVPVPYTEHMAGPEGSEHTNPWLNPIVLRFIQWTTYSFPGAPLADAQASYPVLLFSHGYRGLPELYTTQMEDLANHGYIVVGIVHPYLSGIVVFPDGRTVTGLELGLDDLDRHGEAARPCAQDIVFALDQLAILNADDPEGAFTGRLDLERTGAFGHSLGGTAAALAGTLDRRIQAIVVEDGGVPIGYDQSMLEQPLMFLYGPVGHFPSSGPNHTVLVSGFAHLSFPDFPVWPLRLPDVGTVDGTRTVEIIRVYVRAFFDKYLKGEDSGLLDGPSEAYPEVQIWSRNTD